MVIGFLIQWGKQQVSNFRGPGTDHPRRQVRHRLLFERPDGTQPDGDRAELSGLLAGLFPHRPSQSAQLPLAGQESLVRSRRRAGIEEKGL